MSTLGNNNNNNNNNNMVFNKSFVDVDGFKKSSSNHSSHSSLANQGDDATSNLNQTISNGKTTQHIINRMQIDAEEFYDEATKHNKSNSFPMRKKNSASHSNLPNQNNNNNNQKLKPAPKSTSSIQTLKQHNQNCVNLNQEELSLMVKLAHTRRQESDRLKNLIRNNYWPANHPIRKFLWKSLLQLSSTSSSPVSSLSSSSSNKENLVINTNNSNSNKNSEFSNSSEIEYNKHLNQIFGKCNWFLFFFIFGFN
jgi:hypothetical protein